MSTKTTPPQINQFCTKKTEHKMLVKLSNAGVNFINSLLEHFLCKSVLLSFSLITVWLCIFFRKNISANIKCWWNYLLQAVHSLPSRRPWPRGQVSISPTCLRAAFTCADPKSAKRQSCYQCLFGLLGSAHVKSACKHVGEIDPRTLFGTLNFSTAGKTKYQNAIFKAT